MLKHDVECGPKGMRTTGQRLLEGDKNPNVIGSILLFESGGGQSIAVPEITDAIQACKKPVLAYIDGIACSAAMYAASYCKEIIASRETDIVGSIGTMIAFEDFEKFVRDESGIVHVRIYADGAENKNEEFEQAITGNFKFIKEQILNPVNEQFKLDIKNNRPKVAKEHLTGKTFTAKDVIGILVDTVGTLQYTVDRVAKLAQNNSKIYNNTDMNKYPSLLRTLEVSELAVIDGQSSLNEEQLQTVETALAKASANETNLQNAITAKTQAETNLQTANERIAVLEKELEKKPGANPAGEKPEPEPAQGEETFYGRFNRLKKEFNN
jgi:protease-4